MAIFKYFIQLIIKNRNKLQDQETIVYSLLKRASDNIGILFIRQFDNDVNK